MTRRKGRLGLAHEADTEGRPSAADRLLRDRRDRGSEPESDPGSQCHDHPLAAPPQSGGGSAIPSARRGHELAATEERSALCPSPLVGRRSSRRRSWALNATTTVDADMKIAPTAGDSVTPPNDSTPAASGMAIKL